MSINHLILRKKEAIISKKARYVHKLPFRTSPKICGNLVRGEEGSEFFACNLYIFQYDRECRVR